MESLFLFDIDGTLLRGSTEVHRASFAHAFATVYQRPDLSLDGIAAAGRTDTWLLLQPLRRDGVPEAEIEARMPEAFRVMTSYVEQQVGDLRDRVLPGVPHLLETLGQQGALLGLLTGNLPGIALSKLRAAGLAHYFQTGGFGNESENRAALIPVALAHASQQAGYPIPADQTVVIGDTPFDIEAGACHGTRTAGVATGPFDEGQLAEAGADLVLPSLAAPGTARALLHLAATPPTRA